MKRKWNVETDGAVHTVCVRRNLFGFVKVEIDESSFRLGNVCIFSERSEPFRVGDAQCLLTFKGGRADIRSNDCEITRTK